MKEEEEMTLIMVQTLSTKRFISIIFRNQNLASNDYNKLVVHD